MTFYLEMRNFVLGHRAINNSYLDRFKMVTSPMRTSKNSQLSSITLPGSFPESWCLSS